MRYGLTLCDLPGWSLEGYKRLRDDPGPDSWRDTADLFVKLKGPEGMGAGVAHISLEGFLAQLHSFEVSNTKDPARIVWAIGKFGAFFFGSLQRIYLPQVGRLTGTAFRPSRSIVHRGHARRGA